MTVVDCLSSSQPSSASRPHHNTSSYNLHNGKQATDDPPATPASHPK